MRWTLICDDRSYDEEEEVPGLPALQRTFDFEAVDLKSLSSGLAEAIRGCGFNYLDKIVFVTNEGKEISSDDIFDDDHISIKDVDDLLKYIIPEKKKDNITKFRVIENGQKETESETDK